MKPKNITHYQRQMQLAKFKRNGLKFTFAKTTPKEWEKHMLFVGRLFTYLIYTLKPEYKKLLPYKVTVKQLVAKNQFTSGMYCAINKSNGTLELHLAFDKIIITNAPLWKLVWVIAHEFRHKIQLNSPLIQSVINYPNWVNFNTFMQTEYGQTQDTIDHVLHELNPAEVDANIFASELTGIMFNGNSFDINEQLLGLLKEKQSFKNDNR